MIYSIQKVRNCRQTWSVAKFPRVDHKRRTLHRKTTQNFLFFFILIIPLLIVNRICTVNHTQQLIQFFVAFMPQNTCCKQKTVNFCKKLKLIFVIIRNKIKLYYARFCASDSKLAGELTILFNNFLDSKSIATNNVNRREWRRQLKEVIRNASSVNTSSLTRWY